MFSLQVFVCANFVLQVHFLYLVHCQSESSTAEGSDLVSDEFIRKINSVQSHWKAGRNFREKACNDELRYLVGGRTDPDTGFDSRTLIATYLIWKYWPTLVDEYQKELAILTLPREFDAREYWPKCASIISSITDTGLCASSWAVSTTQAVRDRYCIHHNAQVDKSFSAKHLLDCCSFCEAKQCQSGSPLAAYEYFYKSGLPTGGRYESGSGCKPYDILPLEWCLGQDRWAVNCSRGSESVCSADCTNRIDDRPFEALPYKISKYYPLSLKIWWFWESDKVIKAEIYLRGSVTAEVTVYDDFLNYKGGVYYPTSVGKHFGVLTLRLIGWGRESGLDYWLAANVWGPQWGDSGFVKLKRWDEKMNIEHRVTVGRVTEV